MDAFDLCIRDRRRKKMSIVERCQPNRFNIVQYAIIVMAVVIALSIIGSPMLVSAKNRLQDLVEASQFLKEHGNYGQKKRILNVLSQSDLKLGDAMKIARTVIAESKKHDIPVSLFLAIMKKESNFDVNARSPINAMGIMQIHPLTWDAYTRKLNLDVSRKMAFDPGFNIMVSAALLSDLRDQYLKKGYEETVLWDYVLSSYYAGGESLKEGLKRNHLYYVKKVRQYEREMSAII
jgi:soluble lytic murein transglycosylase-like protein